MSSLKSFKKFFLEKILLLEKYSYREILSKKEEMIEFFSFQKKIIENTKIRLTIMFCYLVGSAVFKFIFKADFNFPIIEVLLILMMVYTLASFYLIKKNVFRTLNSITKFYLGFLTLDLIWLTIIIHYFGGLTWIAVIFYTYYLIYGFLVFPKFKYTMFLFLIISGLLITLGWLEYSGLIPHQPFFVLEPNLYQNINYLASTLIAAIIALYFVAYWSYLFAAILKTEKEKLEETKDSLEVRAEARNKELKELTQSLEEKVQERTKALQEKMEELEKFNKIAIGRELKMIELKKEIARLKKESEKAKT